MQQMPWQLYGTLGCHLCEQAEQLLKQLHDARAIHWQLVDIADLPISEADTLAQHIPVLQAGTTRLFWPFGLNDLVRLTT